MQQQVKRKRLRAISACLLIVVTTIGTVNGQESANTLPRIVEKDGRHILLVDGEPFFVFGGQAHNSSAWPGMLSHVWYAIEALNANTLEVPIYWEQIEPQPNLFDFSFIDTLLVQARERNKHLVLLWFATWKNGSNHYMPEWMKRNARKYPNIMGKDGNPVDSPSPHAKAAMEADAKAFTEVMKHLKEADPQHTVLMVQVQNEPGSWGSVRDYSQTAQKLFEEPVPEALLDPEVLGELNIPLEANGSWEEVFGEDADEYFHAWSVARYIEYVAAAGKAVNPLPLYVNAALRDPLTDPPANTYESGGPTDNVIPIWKAAAPSIDFVAPDIYLRGNDKVLKVLELYAREDNALMVPEIAGSGEYVKYLYKVLEHGGIGFAPFGIDNNGQGSDEEAAHRLSELAQEYKIMVPMMRKLAKWGFEGKIHAVVESETEHQFALDLGLWEAIVSFGSGYRRDQSGNQQPTGKAMVIKLDENECILIGTQCRFTFRPTGKNEGKAWQYLNVKEGWYEEGEFQFLRIRNGDETDWGGPYIGHVPTVLHVTLVTR
jgi:hypothetical protein